MVVAKNTIFDKNRNWIFFPLFIYLAQKWDSFKSK